MDSQATLYRRYSILDYLVKHADNGLVNYEDIMSEFSITKRTVAEDLYFIEAVLHTPLVRISGRYGGITVNKELQDKRFNEKEVEMMKRQYEGMDSEDRQLMRSSLMRCSGPENFMNLHRILGDDF